MLSSLSLIKVKSSIVIDAPIEECWQVCRAWGRQPWMPLLPDGTTFDVCLLEGFSECQIGAIRLSKFGGGSQIYEQLVALDDHTYTMKWQLVSHSNTVSPFQEATFADFFTTLVLHPVTLEESTFAEWSGQFCTEPAYMKSMHSTLQEWYSGGMLSLREYMNRQRSKHGRSADHTGSTHGPNSRQSERMGNSAPCIQRPMK